MNNNLNNPTPSSKILPFEPCMLQMLTSDDPNDIDRKELTHVLSILTLTLDKKFQDPRPLFPTPTHIEHAKKLLSNPQTPKSPFTLVLPDASIYGLLRLAQLTKTTPEELIITLIDATLYANNIASTSTLQTLQTQAYFINLKRRNIPLFVFTFFIKFQNLYLKFIKNVSKYGKYDILNFCLHNSDFFSYIREKFILKQTKLNLNTTYERIIERLNRNTPQKE